MIRYHHQINDFIINRISKDIAKLFPIEHNNIQVNISNIHADYNPEVVDDYEKQKEIKVKEGNLTVPLKATLEIKSPQHRITKEITLAEVPIVTDRFTFIIGGKEYILKNQVRRKPGIYVVKKRDGGEVQFNSASKANFRIKTDDAGVFKIEYQGRTVPLYPILKALGVDEQAIKLAMGNLYEINKTHGETDTQIASQVFKLYQIQTGHTTDNLNIAIQGIKNYWSQYSFDPEVNDITIGLPEKVVTPNVLLKTTQKLRLVIEGKDLGTNANDLKFKTFHSPIDILSERITGREGAQRIKTRIINNLSKKEIFTKPNIVVNKSIFAGPLLNTFKETQLQHIPEQINPIDNIMGLYYTTPGGVGGFTGEYLPEEAREIDDTHFGIIDPIATPSSEKIGLSLTFTSTVDPINKEVVVLTKDKKPIRISIDKFLRSNVTTLDQFEKNRNKIMARTKGGFIQLVSKKDIDYIIHPTSLVSVSTGLIPFINKNHGIRMQMGSKQITQAVPLKDPDKPLISTEIIDADGNIVGLAEHIGSFISPKSPVNGVVKKITDKAIIVIDKNNKEHKVNLPKNFFVNSDSLYTVSQILVKEGDRVSTGQILADLNFTRNGTLTLGKHLRVAYIPYYGYTTKDGVVISDEAAKKLTSEHLYVKEIPIVEGAIIDKDKYQTYYPNKFSKEQLDKLDNSGVIKKGQIISLDDPIVLHMTKQEPDPDERILGKLARTSVKLYKDRSLLWDKEYPGEVVDVIKHKNKISVIIKTLEPATIGDKLATAFGGKGVITNIVPADQMPRTKDGEPIEMIISPLAIPSRMNVGQLYEAALSKVARKTNELIHVNPFEPIKPEEILSLLKDYGISETEELIDPETNKSLGHVTVGYPYIYKLKQRVEKAIAGRAAGPHLRYGATAFTPAKGGKESAQSMDLLTQYALLAHGAKDNLLEMHTYKAEKNEPFWRSIIVGTPPPPPQETQAFKRFRGLLNILGVDVKKQHDNIILTFLDKNEILKISNGELTRPYLALRGKDGMPETGGIFDINLTKGLKGDRYTHFTLSKPIPNPYFEKAIISLTGLTEDQYDKIIHGKLGLNIEKNQLVEKDYDIGGPDLIRRMLSRIDIDTELAKSYQEARTATGTSLNKARDKISYLKALKETNKRPEDVYFMEFVPVIPPIMRPISINETGSRQIQYDDLNVLYRFAGKVNDSIKKAIELGIPDRKLNEMAGKLYDTIAQLEGIIDPQIQIGRTHRGVLKQLAGPIPKTGYIQSVLFSKKQDFSGRAILSQDMNIDIDEAYIPREMAWRLYRPFVIKEITSHGIPLSQAVTEWEERTPLAQTALEKVVESRPLLFNRDPSLHKYNIQALRPKLTSDKTIKMHPLIFKGFNADVDGDAINVYLPTTPNAIREAMKMFPSMNVIKYGYRNVLIHPEEDAVIGLWELTKGPTGKPIEYKKEEDVIKDLSALNIRPTQAVKIGGKIYSAGEIYLLNNLPEEWREKARSKFPFNSKNINSFLRDVYLSGNPNDFKKILKIINDIGEEFAYKSGVTISIKDITVDRPIIEAIKKSAIQDPSKISTLQQQAIQNLKSKKSTLIEMAESGARGSQEAVQKIAVVFGEAVHPFLGKLPFIVNGNYNDGLSSFEYWFNAYSARQGLIQQQIGVKDPGMITKEVMSGMLDVVVEPDDKGDEGLEMSIDNPDIIGRYTARSIIHNGKVILKKDDLITDKVVDSLKRLKIKSVLVRSPLTSLNETGISVKSFGLKDDGRLVEPYENIGVLATHALTEPLTQLILKSKHTDTSKSLSTFNEIKQLLELPTDSVYYAYHAPYKGKISRIENIRGKNIVWIENKPVEVPSNKQLIVKVGDVVEPGDKLTNGLNNYHELINIIGWDKARFKYLDELKDLYWNKAGLPIGQRWLEVVVRRVSNNAIIEDPGIFSDLYKPGDIIPITIANQISKATNLKVKISPYHSGLKLAEKVGKYPPGTEINENNIKDLMGKEAVVTGQFKYRPVMIGLKDIAAETSDWLTAMLTGRIKSQLLHYGAINASLNLKTSKSPFPRLIMAGWNV